MGGSPGELEGLWVDSHAHLAMFGRGEVAEVLDRAADHGVGRVLTPATCRDDLEKTAALAEEYHGRVVAAIGIHPHEASSLDLGLKRAVEQALERPGVVAVGETGLDYHYMNSPREDQLRALEWHLDLAMERGLPVVLHNRESWTDLEGVLGPRAGRLRGVCHSFAEGADEARRVVDLGLAVGFSGMVTFKTAELIREAVKALSPEHVLVETDSPFLAPVPHRGRRNEPAYVVHTAERVAEELEIELDALRDATTQTFIRLFSS